MPSAGRQTHRGSSTTPGTLASGKGGWLLFVSLLFLFSSPRGTAWPHDYRYLYDRCPGPEWSVMCRGCCEYDVIRCKCPLVGTAVGYAVPCCRNAVEECDPCIIHPGCSIFENCKRCNNGTWGPRDDFFISGKYCSECRPGWSGGDCMKCGGLIRKRQGHLVLESYPNNARCEWTIQVDRPFTIELRFMMLSLEFHPSCRYDYVEVRDGDSVNSRVIARLCGNSRPAPIQSSGSSLHILFVSDGYKNFDGFFATFQENSACSSSPCLHDGTCVLDSSHAFHCACLGGYTGKRCENVVGCHRPPVPTHGSTEGLFLHSGARIAFRCDPGFELQGFPTAVCLSDGTWSAPAPECAPVTRLCTLPPKPAHGDHFLVYGPNDVLIALQYLCYQPYELSGNSQRTCLPNNTWSGTRPVCTTVNNTITEDKDEAKEKETETHRHKHIIPTGENGHGNAEEEETTRSNITTGSDREDKYAGVVPEETASEGGNEGEPEERNLGSDRDKVDRKDPDNSLDVGRREPEKKQGSGDANVETGRTDTGQTVGMTDKGQEEKERKEEQVNGERDQDGVGPNDTKLRMVIAEGENTVEIFELGMTKNRSLLHGAPETKKEKVTPASPEQVRIIPAGANVTQHTVYRAGEGGESGKPRGKQPIGKDERNSVEEAKKEEEEERERESNQSFSERSCPPIGRLYHGFHQLLEGAEPQVVEFFCDHSYALSGGTRRTCRPDGTWSGKQPLCVKACREPKVSELVKQRVLPPQTPSRKTPVHKLFSSGLGRHLRSDGPTTGPSVASRLPQGFHHLYTHIEYECASPFYQHFGSSRRTCLKTGKWSGRHVSCSPVCGKHPTFDPERPADSHWPWLAAVYRRSTDGAGTKATEAGSLKRGTGDWQLVCSGALVNQRTVVVAAHCVSRLGKVYPLDPAEIKVVVGKHYRDDRRDSKGLQHLRVATISVHENYDPHVLDSDVAVVKLLDKAKIGEKVLPLCLSDSQKEEGASGRALVTGWSPLPDSGSGPGEKARVGLVQLAHIVPCEQQYARNGVPIGVTDNMLCASQKPDYGPSNICPSDTGGILVLPPLAEDKVRGESNGLWRLLGLVSFGYDQGECDPELYTVYADVARFKDWIESSMK